VDTVHRKNDWQKRMDECGYFMLTDGFFGANVRYISDGESLGMTNATSSLRRSPGLGRLPSHALSVDTKRKERRRLSQHALIVAAIDRESSTLPLLQSVCRTMQIPKGEEVHQHGSRLQIRGAPRLMPMEASKTFCTWTGYGHRQIVVIATYPEKEDDLSGARVEMILEQGKLRKNCAKASLSGTGRHSGVTL